MDKIFRNYDEQINILKTKGLIIPKSQANIRILQRGNYYNIINGYKDLFIDNSASTEQFKSGTTFEEIVALCYFDKKLRKVMFERLLYLETSIKSILSYKFSEKYGSDNYLLFTNFNSFSGVNVKKATRNRRAEQINAIIAKMQNVIAESISKKDYVNHYILDYGYVPFWVLVNAVSFGTISRFYGLMKETDQADIAREFSVNYEDFEEYIKIMAYFRNLCAHNERIYNAKEPLTSIPDTKYHSILGIPKTRNRYIYGKNDLFSLVITFKVLLSNKEYSLLKREISSAIDELVSKLTTITRDDILQSMGFPSNWKNIR